MDQLAGEALALQIQARCFEPGAVTLSSGQTSSYYYDLKRALLASDLKVPIARALLDLVADLEYDVIGGRAIGSVPISEQMSVVSLLESDRPIDTFYVRDKPKTHGTQGITFQAHDPDSQKVLRPGVKVLIVDDVVTTGRSVLEAIEEVQRIGATVVAVAVLIDRRESRADPLRHQFDFRPLYQVDAEGKIAAGSAAAVA